MAIAFQKDINELKELRHPYTKRLIGTYNPNSVDFDTKTNPPPNDKNFQGVEKVLLLVEILVFYNEYLCNYYNYYYKREDYKVYTDQYVEYLKHCIQNSKNESISSSIKTKNYIPELHDQTIEYINLVEFVFYNTFNSYIEYIDEDISLDKFLKNHNVIIDLINFLTEQDNLISNGFMEAFFKIAQEQKDVLNQYKEMFEKKFPNAFESYDERVKTKNPSLYTPQGEFISDYIPAFGAFENNKSFSIVLILIILILIIIVTLAIIKILRKSKKKPSNKTRK
jgi:hypothetical protein